MKKMIIYALLACLPLGAGATGKIWSLQDCIDHALANNISLRKAQANIQTAAINTSESKGALLPSLSANIQQGVNWRPLQESQSNFVNGSIATSSASKATQTGTYGINASWTVWDGQRNKMNVQNSQINEQLAQLSLEESSNNIVEQIANLYVQILYMQEAAKVNEQLLKHDSIVYARGEEMVRQGKMSKADLAQLEAQVASGRYDVVNTRTMIANAKMQLKQLLELPPTDEMEVAQTVISDEAALQLLPSKLEAYNNALAVRPEVKSKTLAVEQSQLATKIARTQRLPSINLTGSLGDSHVTNSGRSYFDQVKNNFSVNIGVGLSIPIFDNRKTKSAVERARVAEVVSQLDLQDTEKELYQTVEGYWLTATNNQQKFIAARTSVASMEKSYELLDEQFRLGLKNIVELLQGRDDLLSAKQSMLQDKYTAVLNLKLLDFYQGKSITL